jgi:Cu2+-exporting ATPase
VPQSIMPGYRFLADTGLDYHDIAAHLTANRAIGAPYTDEQIAHAVADLLAQADPRQRLRADAREVVATSSAKVSQSRFSRATARRPSPMRLDIDAWRAGAKPADKIARIAALRPRGRKVLMVGDGLNDAPSLAAADASLSVASAAHVTQMAADAVFLGDRLSPVAAALAIARRAQRLMRENLVLAIAYNAVAAPIAVLGFASPLIAAIAMSGSPILVTLNALRAKALPGEL